MQLKAPKLLNRELLANYWQCPKGKFPVHVGHQHINLQRISSPSMEMHSKLNWKLLLQRNKGLPFQPHFTFVEGVTLPQYDIGIAVDGQRRVTEQFKPQVSRHRDRIGMDFTVGDFASGGVFILFEARKAPIKNVKPRYCTIRP